MSGVHIYFLEILRILKQDTAIYIDYHIIWENEIRTCMAQFL